MASRPPVIGIPCATYQRPAPYPLAHGNNETYLRAVEAAGGAPILLPLVGLPALEALFDRIDGLLLAGGVDVDPKHYGEEPHPRLGTVNPEQDRVELEVTHWARAAGMPVLAICRGFQVLNIAYGGSLYQDLPAQVDASANHELSHQEGQRDLLAHQMRIQPQSRLGSLLGSVEIPVNTLHHQGIKELAPGLVATGWADDGLIEAVESAEGWVVGVQCHPEELVRGADERWLAVFQGFVAAARSWRSAQAAQA